MNCKDKLEKEMKLEIEKHKISTGNLDRLRQMTILLQIKTKQEIFHGNRDNLKKLYMVKIIAISL